MKRNKDIVSVYADGERQEMSLDDAIRDVVVSAFHPRRCMGCGIPLEYYGEANGIEGWHRVIISSRDYMRCEECDNYFRIAGNE